MHTVCMLKDTGNVTYELQGWPLILKDLYKSVRKRCGRAKVLAEEIIRLYGRRWDIEVFFKMAKSFLKLAKEFQSRSFDALIAHATLVCCRYIMLELIKREYADPRTLGTLFYAVSDEMGQIGFTEALALLLKLLEETLGNVIGLCKEQVQRLIERFVQTLPCAFSTRMLLSPVKYS